VTTNIDKGIEHARPKQPGQIDPVNLAASPDLTRLREIVRNGNIFYLHGSVDDIDNTIFTVDSYYEFYKKPDINDFLQWIFRDEYCVLFIGYSLAEHEILQSMFLALGKRQRPEKRHFLLSPIYSKDLAEFNINRKFFDIYAVKAIPFFIDYEGYPRLHHALSKLAKLKDETKTPDLKFMEALDTV